jgi:hypothetical protein
MAKEFIRILDKSILDKEVPFETDNAYKVVTARTHNEDGTFKADDPETPEDESKESVKVKRTWREFTFSDVTGDIAWLQLTGGYAPDNSFNSKKYPVTEDIRAEYLKLGYLCRSDEWKLASKVELKEE